MNQMALGQTVAYSKLTFYDNILRKVQKNYQNFKKKYVIEKIFYKNFKKISKKVLLNQMPWVGPGSNIDFGISDTYVFVAPYLKKVQKIFSKKKIAKKILPKNRIGNLGKSGQFRHSVLEFTVI